MNSKIKLLFGHISHCKHYLWIFLLALIVVIINIALYPEFIYRGVPVSEFSIFSTTFIKSMVQSFFAWMYLTAVFFLIFFGARFLIRRIKAFFVSDTKPSVGKCLFTILTILLLIVAAIGAAFIYGYFIIGRPNTLGTYFNPYHFLFFLCIIFAVCAGILYLRGHIKSFAHLFLIITLIIGFCYSFSFPGYPAVSWDEAVHYQRSLDASHITHCSYSRADMNMLEMKYSIHRNLDDMVNTYEKIEGLQDRIVLEGARSYFYYLYQYISYLPAGLTLSVCHLLDLSPTLTFSIGRYMNLIMYALLVFFAMKRLRSGHAILAVIAWFPLNVFLASNYSYDWFLTGTVMLGFSYLVTELQTPNEKLTRKNACIMLLSFFFGIGAKAVYFPLILLCLLLPASKFQSKRVHTIFRLSIATAVLIMLATFVLPFVTSSGASGTDVRGGLDVDAVRQIKYALTHPFTYAKVLFHFLFDDYLNLKNASAYTCEFAYLGSVNYGLPIMMLLTAACLVDHKLLDQQVLTSKFRIVTILICGITIVLFASTLYAAYTPVGADTIKGCQARYLEPVIFPLAFCLGSGKIHCQISEKLKYSLFTLFSGYLLFASIWHYTTGLYR